MRDLHRQGEISVQTRSDCLQTTRDQYIGKKILRTDKERLMHNQRETESKGEISVETWGDCAQTSRD